MYDLIKIAIKKSYNEFVSNPYDYMGSERHAQFKLFNILQKIVPGYIKVNIFDSLPPIPEILSNRVRLEYDVPIKDKGKIKRRKSDIVIYKNNSENFEIENIEGFIELKYGWGYTTQHLTRKEVKKDFELVGFYKEIGYFIFYMGNKFISLNKNEKLFYLNKVKEYQSLYNFRTDHIYFIYLDRIITGRDFD